MFQLFLSYCHQQEDLVKQVKEALSQLGLKVWIDYENPPRAGQSLNEWMPEGIKKSQIIVVFFSEDYEKSKNCQRELVYADGIKKPVIYVKAQEKYFPQNWLQFICKNALYHDVIGKNYEKGMGTLRKQINNTLELLSSIKEESIFASL